MTEAERLGPLTIKAAGRFLEAAQAGELAGFNEDADFNTVATWLMDVKHTISTRFRKKGTNAHATYRTNTITYNPVAMAQQTDEQLFEVVLHELGHLFIGKFVSTRIGHGNDWKILGWIVGYAPVGSTRDQKRSHILADIDRYRTAAHKKGRFG